MPQVAIFSRAEVIGGMSYPAGAPVPVEKLGDDEKNQQRRLRQLVEFHSVKMVEVGEGETIAGPRPTPAGTTVPATMIARASDRVKELKRQLRDAEAQLATIRNTVHPKG